MSPVAGHGVRTDSVLFGNAGAFLTSAPLGPPAELDPLEFVHQQPPRVPARGQHQVRCDGAYAHRLRQRYRERQPDVARAADEVDATPVSGVERAVDRDDPLGWLA